MLYSIFDPALIIGCLFTHYLLCFTKSIKCTHPGVPVGCAATLNYETICYFSPFDHRL